MEDFDSMLKMVKMLETPDAQGLEEYSLKNSIKDWNVSHSTLEEVFMKVTKEKEEWNSRKSILYFILTFNFIY